MFWVSKYMYVLYAIWYIYIYAVMHRNILPSFRCVIREGVKGCNPSFAAMKWWWSLTYTGRCNWLQSCSVNNQQVLTLLMLCWCCRHCRYVVGVSKLLEWCWHVVLVLVGLVLLVCCCCYQFWGSNPIDVTSMYVSKNAWTHDHQFYHRDCKAL